MRWKLDANQRAIYDTLQKAPRRRFYLNCGRRVGKTYLFAVIALETALRTPGAVIKVAAPTAKAVRQFIKPIYLDILHDCPKNIRPEWNSMDGEWRFKNGSVISIAGCDSGNAESLRGPKAHLVQFDECGFIDNLKYISSSIMAPMLMTTKGWMMYASTPSPSPDHDSVRIFRELSARGCAVTRTIYDNPRLSLADLDEFLEDERGLYTLEEFKQTVTFRREYLAEFIVDQTRAVVPAWFENKLKCIGEEKRPTHFDAYVSLDIGFKDAHGALFGYWDFLKAILVIEDEVLLFKKTTDILSEHMRGKEKALWGEKRPYLRVADSNLLTLADIQKIYGLPFVPTRKDDKELQINTLNMWVAAGKVRIHPRCVNLIEQLATTIWNAARTTYERNSMGHGDLVDALVYMVRNVHRHRNPYPDGEIRDPNVAYFTQGPNHGGTAGTLLSLFGPKRGVK